MNPLDVHCPLCDAKPGEPCTLAVPVYVERSAVAVETHTIRKIIARKGSGVVYERSERARRN